jgi:hypothetical protein
MAFSALASLPAPSPDDAAGASVRPSPSVGAPAQLQALRKALISDAWRRFPALQAAAAGGRDVECGLTNVFVADYALLRARPDLPAAALVSGDDAAQAALSEGVFDLIQWLVRSASGRCEAEAASPRLARRLLDAYRAGLPAAILERRPLGKLEREARARIAAALAAEAA